MDESTRQYRVGELRNLGDAQAYQLKITDEGGGGTKWLRITPGELARIVQVLTGGETREVYLLQRETFDGIYAFAEEDHRDAYAAFLAGYEIEAEAGSVPVITGDAAFAEFMANESASLDEEGTA